MRMRHLLVFAALWLPCLSFYALFRIVKPAARSSRIFTANGEARPAKGGGGAGEWEDWENSSYMEDPVDGDDEDAAPYTPSTSFFADLSKIPMASASLAAVAEKANTKAVAVADKGTVNSALASAKPESEARAKTEVGAEQGGLVSRRREGGEDWAGWSEEPPYFDDEEGEDSEEEGGIVRGTGSFFLSGLPPLAAGGSAAVKGEAPTSRPSSTPAPAPAPVSKEEGLSLQALELRVSFLEAQLRESRLAAAAGSGYVDRTVFLTCTYVFMALFLTLQFILVTKL